jgi:thiamine pyrophosphokinase
MNPNAEILLGNGNFPEKFLEKNSVFSQLLTQFSLTAVDGGANHCKKYNILAQKIQKIIGDLDSVSSGSYTFFTQQKVPVQKISDQNSTDLEKALVHSSADVFFAFGFLGEGFDHELSLLHILQKYHLTFPHKKIICFSSTQIFFVLPNMGEIHFEKNNAEHRVSFYPLTSTAFKKSAGLEYPLDGLTLEQGKMIGTSNQSQKNNFSGKILWEMELSKNPENNICLGFFPLEESKKILSQLFHISLF